MQGHAVRLQRWHVTCRRTALAQATAFSHDALQGCLWWRQHHFASAGAEGEPERTVLALRTGRASAEALEAQAVVAAAVHGLWVQARVAAVARWGGGRLLSG